MPTYSEIYPTLDSFVFASIYKDSKCTPGTSIGRISLTCMICIGKERHSCREVALKKYIPETPIRLEVEYTTNKQEYLPIELLPETHDFLDKYLIGINKEEILSLQQCGKYNSFIIHGHKNRYIAFHNVLVLRTALYYSMLKKYYNMKQYDFPYSQLDDRVANNLYRVFSISMSAIKQLIEKYGYDFESAIFLRGYTIEKYNNYKDLSDLDVLMKSPMVHKAYNAMFADIPKAKLTRQTIVEQGKIVEEDDTKMVVRINLKLINNTINKNSYAYFKFDKKDPNETLAKIIENIGGFVFRLANNLCKIEINSKNYKMLWEKEKSKFPLYLKYTIMNGVLALADLDNSWQ